MKRHETKNITLILGLLMGFFMLVSTAHAQSSGLLSLTPDPETGFDTAELDSIVSEISRLRPLKSLIIFQKDTVVLEFYGSGYSRDRAVNIKSASKSVLSALVGLALKQDHLRDITQPIGEFFPELLAGEPREKREITIRDLMLMRSGLEPTSFENYGPWVSSSHWLKNALERPLDHRPGEKTSYSTGNSHILAAVLAEATGQDLRTYAQDHLFGPLGVRIHAWQKSPEGYRFGGNNLSTTPQAMLRFGRLYLNGGTWQGKRILPERWIRRSTSSHVYDTHHGYPYGYLWWNASYDGYDVNFAWGHGGQYVFFVPELELVVVTTSNLQSVTETGGFTNKVHRLLRNKILPSAELPSEGFFSNWEWF